MSLNFDPLADPTGLRVLKEIESYGDEGDDIVESINWDDPRSFFEVMGLPEPSSFPKPEQVRKEAHQRARNIFSDWTLLNRIIERYESIIQKRWLKRTREQRKSVLLAAWPNMSPIHRPDFDAFAREKPGRHQIAKDPYMWPHINLEDLLKPKLLLIFLNARGRNPPCAFSGADADSAKFGMVTGKLKPAFLNLYTMVFIGRNSPDTYGELIAWDDNPDASSWVMARKGFLPGEGLQLLEIQERLYHFLVDCCLTILHDMSRESLLGGDAPIQPEPPMLSISETGLNSLATVAAEGPYRLPARLNLVRIKGIIAAKRSAAEDHIWSLREDPGYFADVVLAAKDHRLELLPDTRGNRHPSLRPHSEGEFWNRVLGNIVADAYFSLAVWDRLHSQIADVQPLMSKYKNDIVPEKDLPEELLKAFSTLDYSLGQFAKGPIGNLQANVPASPPLRAFYVREPTTSNSSEIRARRHKPPNDKGIERLLWIFQTMWNDTLLHNAGLHTLMDEMERLIQSDPKIKGLISPMVVTIISDLSVISECRHQISLFQPWAASFQHHGIENAKANYDDTVKKWIQFNKTFEGTMLGKLGAPSDQRFFYPVEKRRTRETTEAMRRAERNLDEFWANVDNFLVNKAGMSQHQAIRHLLSDSRILRRTPEWVENPEVEKQDSHGHSSEDICRPLSQFYFELEHRTQSTLRREEESIRKSKVKTRGTAQAVELPKDAVSEPTPEIDVEPSFTVDKRAFKVFSTLFYTPSRTSQPGEIAWTDFLHAMGSVGFGVEKLYGSVWQFTPGGIEAERGIQFHEPHPSGKISFRIVRRNGRRLFRAYGWHARMFGLCE